MGREHRSSSSDACSPVGDDFQGQQLADGSSVETSLLEESDSVGMEDVDTSFQHRMHERASRAGELIDRRYRSIVRNEDRIRRSRSLTVDDDARTLQRRGAAASPRSQYDKGFDLPAKSSAPSGRGTSACATGSKSTASC